MRKIHFENIYWDTPPKVIATGNSLDIDFEIFISVLQMNAMKWNVNCRLSYLNEVEEAPGDNGIVVKGHVKGDYGAADSNTAHIRRYLFEIFDRKLIKNFCF